jgi:hypothetical protein
MSVMRIYAPARILLDVGKAGGDVLREALPRMGRVLPVAAGLAAAALVVSTSPYKKASLWPVWALFAIALGGASGGVFLYGMNQWRALPGHTPQLERQVAVKTTMLATAVLGSFAVLAIASGRWRGPALMSLAAVGAIPAAATMYGIEHSARQQSATAKPGARAARLMALRRIAQGLLPALGWLVALSTFALAASIQVYEQLEGIDPSRPNAARLQILVFGFSGSAVVGLLFGAAGAALRRHGRQLCDELFDLEEAADGATLLSMAEERQKLEQLLGLDRGLLAELQTGVIVLGPLLASAGAVFLPR